MNRSASTLESTTRTNGRPAATHVAPLIEALAPGLAARVELWDGSVVGPDDGPPVRIRSADALRRLLWAPGELGLARAYVAGEIDFDGDLFDTLVALRPAGARLRIGSRQLAAIVAAARETGAIGPPPPAPPEEARPHGIRHSRARDAEAVSHHYDVGNDFYRLVLGPSMTYSCARFADAGMTLEDAQRSKHDLVCRKLGLHERSGARLLDVGCGWGSMAIHAASTYGTQVVGITISREQFDAAVRRVAKAGVEGLVEIRLQDYREVEGERFDAISSVGGSTLGPRTFVGRYVFPDGELIDVGRVVLAMEGAGIEVRDVESLREHYATTLRQWVANLEARWDDAVALVGEHRARIWRLYMAASAVGFEDGGVALHQVRGVAPEADGTTGMPRTRDGWATAGP
jgi:cyclopropane-fatty-acyl-phospholipid synthase